MTDALVTEAAKPILDVGIVGSICFFLMIVLAFREKFHQARFDNERVEHQKTRDAHLKDVKDFAAIGESMRDQMKSLVSVIQAATEIMKERGKH